MREDLDLNRLLAARQTLPPAMARGVDLNVIRDKRDHQHRWVIVAHFAVPEGTLRDMAELKLRLESMTDEEKASTEPVPLPIAQDNMIGFDGPGCMKCGIHWQGENGYGALCRVGDTEFFAAMQKAGQGA